MLLSTLYTPKISGGFVLSVLYLKIGLSECSDKLLRNIMQRNVAFAKASTNNQSLSILCRPDSNSFKKVR